MNHNLHITCTPSTDMISIKLFLLITVVCRCRFFIFSSSRFPSAQVSSIYADASIGNSIKIAVVHIMYIEHDLVVDASSGNGKYGKILLQLLRLPRQSPKPRGEDSFQWK